jgi:uncharacterized protein (TIGR03435 family)
VTCGGNRFICENADWGGRLEDWDSDMKKLGDVLGARRRRSLIAALAAVVPIVFGAATAAQVVSYQTVPVSPDDPKFAAFVYDVASIKPNKGDDTNNARTVPDGMVAREISLAPFVAVAYGVDYVSLKGAPDWLVRDKFDIDFKMEPAVADAYKQLSLPERKLAQEHMLQTLFRERMKLAVHAEMKEGPSYALVVTKGGLKFHRTADANASGGTFKIESGEGGVTVVTSHGGRVDSLVNTLTDLMGVPVINQTGLVGSYDFTLKFAPARMAAAQAAGNGAPAPETAPELATAIQEQLGLKLEPTKGPIKIVVIDHVERPSAN